MHLSRHFEAGIRRLLARIDAAVNRLYGWEGNPLYQSGTITAALLLIVTLTGIYLLFFYRLGDPYASIARVTDQWWGGRWIRGLHRYASDAAVVAVLVHATRLYAQGRSWGPRALAWVSGVGLLALVMICGWTGYVMIWDVQGQLLAQEGARLLDRLPIFSEPISRAFVSEKTLPSAFFFLNLFLHVALPIGLGLLLWVHVTRVARPVLLPPKRLAWAITGALTALALIRPVVMEPRADLATMHAQATLDLFYSFWLPAAMALSPDVVWALTLIAWAVPALVPWWARPRAADRPPTSVVDEKHCTGCEQCYLDCPYEAIAMLPLPDEGERMVARVDPSLCVSCGLCTGSCAPMRVGPPARTGRDQLVQIQSFTAAEAPSAETVAIVACRRGAGGITATGVLDGARVHSVECVGNLHTSSIEYLVRSGVQGVLIVSCPPRDCWTREGVTWMEQRLYHEREAELQARVDRRRIRVVHAALGEHAEVRLALASFREELHAIGQTEAEVDVSVQRACDTELTTSGTS